MNAEERELLDEFLLESTQNLRDIEQDMLSLEQSGQDPECINRIFRAIHSMKGSSGYLNLKNILAISHLGESILDQIRQGHFPLTPEVADVLLDMIDRLRSLMEMPDFGDSEDVSDILGRLSALCEGEGGALPPDEDADGETVAIDTHPILGCSSQLRINAQTLSTIPEDLPFFYFIRYDLHAYMQATGDSPVKVIDELGKAGSILAAVIDNESDHLDSMMEDERLFYDFLYATVLEPGMVEVLCGSPVEMIRAVGRDALEELVRAGQETGDNPEPAPSANPAPVHPGKETPSPSAVQPPAPASPSPTSTPTQDRKEPPSMHAPAHPGSKPASPSAPRAGGSPATAATAATPSSGDTGQMMKVNSRFLDELLRLTGNMVMARNQLLTRYDFSEDAAFVTLSQAIGEVHRSVVQTRMETVNSLFDRFRRVVRDLAKQLGKSVELRTEGGDLELDRTILESFTDPMMHMVRNCIDHAIEAPDVRLANSKPRVGTVTLRAYHQSGEIVIEVEDDGRGIDPDRIRAKASEKRVVPQADLDAMTDADVLYLIFHPGFSTAEAVSDVSGRGVGMDVVKTNIERIGGVIDLHSRLGQGTRFAARLPLAKALVSSSLISSVIIRIGTERFALPQTAINELIRVSPQDRARKIKLLEGQEVFQLRELVLPIIHLEEALEIDPAPSAPTSADGSARDAADPVTAHGASAPGTPPRAQTLIVLQFRNHLFGILVDEIIGIEEIVVRESPTLVRGAGVFSGHTVLGDGQVAMLVDINGVVERMGMRFPETTRQENPVTALSVGRRADQQTMILFNYAPEEYFAIPLDLISLVEKIEAKDIRRVGEREYYPFKNQTLPILYLDHHLPITPIHRKQECYNLLFPARVTFPLGILTNLDISVIEISEHFDSRITHEKGILGSFMHEGKLVMLLDLYSLFEHDAPEHFTKKDTGRPLRILFAEDSLFYRRLISKYLETAGGHKITLANDGKEALDLLRTTQEPFDLIISDIEMPRMDGFELIQTIRGDSELRDLPVIALTALADHQSRERGMRLGFDEYVVKVDKSRLLDVIATMGNAERPKLLAAT